MHDVIPVVAMAAPEESVERNTFSALWLVLWTGFYASGLLSLFSAVIFVWPNSLDLHGTATGASANKLYDKTMGITLLEYSNAAYCTSEVIENDGKNSSRSTFKWSGDTEGFNQTYAIEEVFYQVHGYIGYHEANQMIVVAFQGTNSLSQAIVDLEVNPDFMDYPHCSESCWVHSGFYNSVQSVKWDILPEVSRLKKLFPKYEVWVTGHSLGGAQAVLIALEMVLEGVVTAPPPGVYTYGAPRVGNRPWARLADGLLPGAVRVTHARDIVPHVPFAHAEGYYHHGTEVFEDRTGQLHTCQSYVEDPDCANQYWPIECNIKDHLDYLGVTMGECIGPNGEIRSWWHHIF